MSHMTNPLVTVDQLYKYKSLSALPQDLQDAVFYQVQLLTQAAGLLLRLPQSATAQANVLLARCLVAGDPTALTLTHEPADVSAATLFLTAKLGAHPVPPRDLSNVYAYLQSPTGSSRLFRRRRRRQAPGPSSATDADRQEEEARKDDDDNVVDDDPSTYYLSETAYTNLHNRVLAAEARILALLSFDTHVALPHPLAITYLQALDFLSQPRGRIAKRTVEYLNTALQSPQCLYLTHQPNQLAVAAIYNAARDLGAKMPECAWWEVFDVDREDLGFLVVGMRSLESWVRKQAEDPELSVLGGSLITKKEIKDHLRKKGIQVVANGATRKEIDEEDAMMRDMDEMAAQIDV